MSHPIIELLTPAKPVIAYSNHDTDKSWPPYPYVKNSLSIWNTLFRKVEIQALEQVCAEHIRKVKQDRFESNVRDVIAKVLAEQK